jgi:hypothetical protein
MKGRKGKGKERKKRRRSWPPLHVDPHSNYNIINPGAPFWGTKSPYFALMTTTGL